MTAAYAWLKFLHVAAALWVATGIFGSAVVRVQAKRANGVLERALAVRILWRLHTLFTLPGVVLAGLLGFYLVSVGGFRFNELWVTFASLLFLLLFLSTLFLVTPALSRQKNAAAQATTAADGGARLAAAVGEKLPGIFSDVNALIVVILVLLMVTKP